MVHSSLIAQPNSKHGSLHWEPRKGFPLPPGACKCGAPWAPHPGIKGARLWTTEKIVSPRGPFQLGLLGLHFRYEVRDVQVAAHEHQNLTRFKYILGVGDRIKAALAAFLRCGLHPDDVKPKASPQLQVDQGLSDSLTWDRHLGQAKALSKLEVLRNIGNH